MRGLNFQCRAAALAMAMLGVGTLGAKADLLGNDFAGIIYDVNVNTGAATNARNTGLGANSLVGIAMRSDGTLFGMTTGAGSLYTINTTTGTPTLIGSSGLSSVVEGDLAFDPTSGILYGTENGSPRNIFTINTATGAATIIGSGVAGSSDLSAITFTSTGTLLAIDTTLGKLFTLDKTNLNIITSVNLSLSLGSTAGMGFDPSSGKLYVADGFSGGTNRLYTLDVPTGALTLVGSTTGAPIGLAGLAFPTAAVPEPSILAMACAGAFFALGYSRFRSRRAAE